MINLSPEIAGLIGTGIGALSSIIMLFISKKYEEKKEFRKTFIEAGIKNWEGVKNIAQNNRSGGKLSPLDTFIIHQAKLLKLIEGGRLCKCEIKNFLKESKEVIDIFSEHSKGSENRNN
jgi:hypothetical protein